MVEFGEKLKQLREEKGMTQQTLAEKLYVTRQAVSRWECGARYPDLLTAKKIAQILEVSIDELLSGEELKQNIEKEPILAQPAANILQTILYTSAAGAYLLMCIFSAASFMPVNMPANTPAGKVSLLDIVTVSGYVLNLAATATGLVLSAKNRLTAKVTGYIMWMPYLIASLSFLFTYIETKIKKNGQIGIDGLIEEVLLPLLLAIVILLFFKWEERRIPYQVILLISVLTIGNRSCLYAKRVLEWFLTGRWFTQLGFVVHTVHYMGKMAMAFLLAYQAYVWNRKKTTAYKSLKESSDALM